MSTEAQDKMVLMTGTVFENLIQQKADADGIEYQITWGEPTSGMTTYYSPNVTMKPAFASPPPDPLDTAKPPPV